MLRGKRLSHRSLVKPCFIAGNRCRCCCATPAPHASFNPRPALLAGDADIPTLSVLAPTFQSTPAIAGGRSRADNEMSAAIREFQSTPAIAGGRSASRCHPSSRWASFNPRPPLLAGDPRWRRGPAPATGCFNPRPPLLAGDPRAGGCAAPQWSRFNPRPPLLAGDPQRGLAGRVAAVVSIHARHCWRAIRPGLRRALTTTLQ